MSSRLAATAATIETGSKRERKARTILAEDQALQQSERSDNRRAEFDQNSITDQRAQNCSERDTR